MEELKKKELMLAARAMSQEEFNKLVAAQNEATFDLFFASVGNDDGRNGCKWGDYSEHRCCKHNDRFNLGA